MAWSQTSRIACNGIALCLAMTLSSLAAIAQASGQTTPAPAQPGPASTRGLPAPTTPLRVMLQGLRQRSASGDGSATCRLAAELEACRTASAQLGEFEGSMQWLERAAQQQSTPKGSALVRESNEQTRRRKEPALRQRAQRCEGVPAASRLAILDLWRTAALAGNTEGMSHYASGSLFRGDAASELAGEIPRYRDEAGGMALEAASRGDVRAAIALAIAYRAEATPDQRGLLGSAVDPDAIKSLALLLRVQQALVITRATAQTGLARRAMVAGLIQTLRPSMSPEDIAQAQSLAGQWQRSWKPMDVSPRAMDDDLSLSPDSAIVGARCGG
jgi:hypothetical protein